MPQAAETGAGSQQEPPATTEPVETGAQGGSGTMSPPSNSEVYFDFDSYLIRPADNATLINFAKYLAANPAQKLKITGYTDSIDTDEYNIRLSKNRARAVYDYLIQQGILPKQLELDWKGETNPKGDNRTKEGRQKNRRVELQLF
jgi:outer membrane protein OmpA-like peptidoglycan-associated protein